MLKRNIPNNISIAQRKELLEKYRTLQPISHNWYGFDNGNTKTGISNCHGETVLVWNLPPVSCCPGASECLNYCYNADERTDKFPIDKWCINWFWTMHKPQEALMYMDKQIKSISNPVIRIHSSGDFYSNEYICLWIELITRNPQAKFWAYTRSWKITDLSANLGKLHSLENIQLFASLDETSPTAPPTGWRYCIVGTAENNSRLLNCPEQYDSNHLSCVNCRICYSKREENIYFTMH